MTQMNTDVNQSEVEKLSQLKANLLKKIQEAQAAAYEYFCECPVGTDRERANEIYERIRTSTRFPYS